MRRQKTTDYHVTVQISFSAAALHHASVMLDWHETIFASMLSSSRHLHNKQQLNRQSESDPWFTLAGISMNTHDLHCNAMRWEVPRYVCVSAHRSGSVTRNPPPPTVKKSARSRLIRQTDKSVERPPSCRSVRVGTPTRPIKPLSRCAQALWFFTEKHSHTNQMKVSSRGRPCRTSHCNAELIRLRGFFFFFSFAQEGFFPIFCYIGTCCMCLNGQS